MERRRLMLKIAGEIGTKSARTRRRFLRVLIRNVHAALERAGTRAQVENRWSRLLVDARDPGVARDALPQVFGVHSVAQVAPLAADTLDALVAEAAALFRDRVAGKTFAVRARRAGARPYRSHDVAVALGTALLPGSAGVNLDEPDVEVGVEVSEEGAYAVLDRVPGAGGLPLGTGGRAVALFSGGFDSPVAAHMAMRRGTEVDFLICDLEGCGQPEAALVAARDLAGRWAAGREPRAHVVDFVPVIRALRDGVESRLRQIVLKRAMYRAGTALAQRVGADALVTGESLGQVSTQTLRNLAVAEEAAGVPVLRPLIGMDKVEIIARARAIGTHDASARVREHCAIATGRVETAARLAEVVDAEGQVEEAFIKEAVEERREVDLVAWEPQPRPEYVVERVPEDAVVVDLREPDEGPLAGDLRMPFSRLEEWMPTLDPGTTYLFVCSLGVRSALVAGELRQRGFRAFALEGGAARVAAA